MKSLVIFWAMRKGRKIKMCQSRWHKQMERYSMFLGRKNQFCENGYTTKHNLQIQCNPYQITNGIFHRTRTKKLNNSYGNTKDPK